MGIFHIHKKENRLSKEQFETIYKTYYHRLYYYSFQIIKEEETSKDIINDVFEKIWSQRNKLFEDTLSSYLYMIVRNKCIDYLRHKNVEQQYAELYDIIVSDDSEDYGLYEDRLLLIEKIIAGLGEPTKSIFTKCYFDNKKYVEVAQEYGISSSGVKKHIMKVLGLIRKECGIRK